SFESLRSVLKSGNQRKWFSSGLNLKKFWKFKEFKEGIGFGRLAGLMGLLIVFAMGVTFFFSAPHSQESDLQRPVEIAEDLDIAEESVKSGVVAGRVQNTENEKVPDVPDVPMVEFEFEADTPSIASTSKDDVEKNKEKSGQVISSSLDNTNGFDGEEEVENLEEEEVITDLTLTDEIDQSEEKPPVESQGVVKIEKATAKKILDQEKIAGDLPIEPRKIILDVRSGSASLTADGLRTLLNFIEKLEQYPNTRLLVKGFVSAKSNTPENIKISKERAQNVQKLMQEKGIEAKRIEVVGMGNQEPIASNDTAEGRNKNRRVEVSIIDDVSKSDEGIREGGDD
ncbi:MAG: OmpA family protein, partial [Desulforhopalus sp.]